MFGYVNINKLELKFREYYQYRGYYCGLCMSLKRNYSELSRLALNYDLTFLVLVLGSLYETEDKVYTGRCVAHPVKKHMFVENEITDYAAALNVILAYYSLKDDWQDEKDVKSLAFSKLIANSFKKASKKYEEKECYIKEALANLNRLEEENTCDIDAISNEFGYLMGELFVYKKDHWEDNLRKIGLYLGKFIYILDAYLDYEKDEKKGSFNPFINIKKENENANIQETAESMIMLNLSFLDAEIDKLPLIKDKGIIDNIIYSGIKIKLNRKGNKDK